MSSRYSRSRTPPLTGTIVKKREEMKEIKSVVTDSESESEEDDDYIPPQNSELSDDLEEDVEVKDISESNSQSVANYCLYLLSMMVGLGLAYLYMMPMEGVDKLSN